VAALSADAVGHGREHNLDIIIISDCQAGILEDAAVRCVYAGVPDTSRLGGGPVRLSLAISAFIILAMQKLTKSQKAGHGERIALIGFCCQHLLQVIREQLYPSVIAVA
jgi:hypothetical protein